MTAARANLPRDEAEGGDVRWDWVTIVVALLAAVILLVVTFELWVSHPASAP
jgi:hypothetical protein